MEVLRAYKAMRNAVNVLNECVVKMDTEQMTVEEAFSRARQAASKVVETIDTANNTTKK